MNIIGFANQYYTLWDFSNETIYFTDSYGNNHPVRIQTNYYYIKNVSMDLDKVKSLYPELTIDENLKGKNRNFSISNENEDLSPEILKFGKYFGSNINDIVETVKYNQKFDEFN